MVSARAAARVGVLVATAVAGAVVHRHLLSDEGPAAGAGPGALEIGAWADEYDEDAGDVAQRAAGREEDAGLPVWQRERSDVEVRKTVRWANARVVLVSGLAGIGYEPFRDAVTAVCGRGGVECEAVCAASSFSLWFPELVRKHSSSERHFRDALREVRRKVDEDPTRRTVFFLNLLDHQCRGASGGEASNDMQYPSSQHWGADTFPDLHWLAAVAEQEKVDLRLVPLLLPRRDARGQEDDVVARVREIARKKFATWPAFATAKALEGGMQAMFAQLSAVSARFFLGLELEAEAPQAGGEPGPGHLAAQRGRLDAWLALPGLEAELRKQVPGFVAKHHSVAQALGGNLKQRPEWDVGLYAYAGELRAARDQLAARALGLNKGGRGSRMAAKAARPEPLVPKRAFSTPEQPRPKLLFFAGLEGTGHHLWHDTTIRLMDSKELLPACAVSSILFQNHGRFTMWFARNADSYFNATVKLRTRLNALRDKDKGEGKVYLANLMQKRPYCGIHAGMMSYPNYESPYKAVQRPNLVTLARACEEAGVDLRVISLVRDSNEVIRSTSDHRSFGGGGHHGEAIEIRYLTVNAHALMAQMAAIDPRFVVHCFDQDDQSLPGLDDLARETSLPTLQQATRQSVNFHPPPPDFRRVKDEGRDKRRASMLFSLKSSEHLMRSLCPS